MATIWTVWWAWIVAGFALGVLEVIVPGFIFLGFALGAVVTGIAVALGLSAAGLPATLLVFALASLLSWLVVRKLVVRDAGQVKVWDRDINDNKP